VLSSFLSKFYSVRPEISAYSYSNSSATGLSMVCSLIACRNVAHDHIETRHISSNYLGGVRYQASSKKKHTWTHRIKLVVAAPCVLATFNEVTVDSKSTIMNKISPDLNLMKNIVHRPFGEIKNLWMGKNLLTSY